MAWSSRPTGYLDIVQTGLLVSEIQDVPSLLEICDVTRTMQNIGVTHKTELRSHVDNKLPQGGFTAPELSAPKGCVLRSTGDR